MTNYVAANLAHYTRNASDRTVQHGQQLPTGRDDRRLLWRGAIQWGDLYALAGLRYETTDQSIRNYLPVPFTSTTNFAADRTTTSSYAKLLPSLNLSYDVTDEIKLRGAVTQNLARPEYAQLAENSSAIAQSRRQPASETISNPNLKPRESTNYDLSAEYYPAPGVVASVALFDKEIQQRNRDRSPPPSERHRAGHRHAGGAHHHPAAECRQRAGAGRRNRPRRT